MATFASRISDLTNAIATAVNARSGKVGASAYELAVINGYTGTQTQWLRGAAPREMTSAQRQALSGSDLWERRSVFETDTGAEYLYSATGGYWFHETAAVMLTWNGAKYSFSSNGVTLVPFDTLAQNDSTGVYTTTTGSAASIKINRGGTYRINSTVLYLIDSPAYMGLLIQIGGGTTREVDYYNAGGRCYVSQDLYVAEGATATVQIAMYTTGSNPNIPAGNGTQVNQFFQIVRVGN